MLRHAYGYALANEGHDTRDTRAIQGWLGHRSITSTAYTALAPNRFKEVDFRAVEVRAVAPT
jgi:site-specific recombinase XerD